MDQVIVTHTNSGTWSVWDPERALCVHLTEEEALCSAFRLAMRSNRAGQKTAVVLEEAQDATLRWGGARSHPSWHHRRRSA